MYTVQATSILVHPCWLRANCYKLNFKPNRQMFRDRAARPREYKMAKPGEGLTVYVRGDNYKKILFFFQFYLLNLI